MRILPFELPAENRFARIDLIPQSRGLCMREHGNIIDGPVGKKPDHKLDLAGKALICECFHSRCDQKAVHLCRVTNKFRSIRFNIVFFFNRIIIEPWNDLPHRIDFFGQVSRCLRPFCDLINRADRGRGKGRDDK